MPPTPMAPQPDELTGLKLFLDTNRRALLEKLDGLTDEQAASRPTVSDLRMLTLVKHVAYVERRWMRGVAGLDMTGYWPPSDPEEEGRIDPGDTVASIRALYDGIAVNTDEILAGGVDLDAVNEIELNARWILLHLIEELARHAGHADILRESIDGTTGV